MINVTRARFRLAVALGGLALTSMLLAACDGDAADEGAPTAEALTTVTLMLNWTPNNHHAGIYVAQANGWYREVGIDLQIVEPAAATADQVVASGAADFGISQAESILPARAAGAEVVSIATLLPHNDSSMMALASSGITRPRDFEGKTYGGWGGPLEQQLLNELVACDGGDPSAVTFVEVGNIDYLAGMEQGRFDVVWVFEGWDVLRATEVEGKAMTSVAFIDYLDCIPDWYTPTIIANQRTLDERPELVRAFLAATARGYAVAIEDPEQAATLLLLQAPELDETLVRASATYHATRYASDGAGWGVQSVNVWTRFEAFLRESGLLEREVDPAAAFTNEFLPAQ
ncbi:MAG: ABC transporter substrate-binding protein [Chloroflexi bacterium]|nr:ABC transporter substrate-binding protein [Chloroflexota bacterium]MDA1240225.1 ABC transporter substrate-binding protein [Chloroflexota bacterium]